MSVLFTKFIITSTLNLIMSPSKGETFEHKSLFTSNSNFYNDSRVLGQVTDHGLIMSTLTGGIVLKKHFCTFGTLVTLALFSLRSRFFTVPLKTFFWAPNWRFTMILYRPWI